MASDGEVESYLKITHHPPVDHCGKVGWALCPYFPRLGVHVGQLLVGFHPFRPLSGSVSVSSPIVSDSHAQVIQPSV